MTKDSTTRQTGYYRKYSGIPPQDGETNYVLKEKYVASTKAFK